LGLILAPNECYGSTLHMRVERVIIIYRSERVSTSDYIEQSSPKYVD